MRNNEDNKVNSEVKENVSDISNRLKWQAANWKNFKDNLTLIDFNMHIARAYNAGKQNMTDISKDGKEAFKSSVEYFSNEFSELEY